MEKFPSNYEYNGEIMPPDLMERGDVRSIDDEITYHEDQSKRPGISSEHVRMYDIEPLQEMQGEGYKFIMRLPRVNHSVLEDKYGWHYDKTVQYFEFLNNLARRAGITRFKHTFDDYYVFDTREDAEKLKLKIVERQESAELKFETIEGELRQ